jgi:arylsulfatase
MVTADAELPVGQNLILSASFDKDGEQGPGVATGMLSLYVGDKKVGEGRIALQPGAYAIAGAALTVGRSRGAVSSDYPGQRPWRFTGGTIKFVAVDVSGEPYVDLEREAAAMLARE